MVSLSRFAFHASLVSLLALTGCSGIRVVRRAPDSGTVALVGPQGAAREKAERYMHQQCPTGYEVVEETEAVVGQSSSAESRRDSRGVVRTSSSTSDTVEWRISYRCNGSPQARIQSFVVGL